MPIRFGFEVENKGQTPALIQQVHGARIVSASHLEPSIEALPEADGLVSQNAQLPLFVFTADCIPLLVASPSVHLAVHCGWRGALSGIARKALECVPDSEALRIVFGPSILSCCFEVKEDFVNSFRSQGRRIEPYLSSRNHASYCDLARFVIEEDIRPIRPDADIVLEFQRCTYCSTPTLPSYRRNGNTERRIRAWIHR